MLNDTDYSALQSGLNTLNTSLNAAGTSISTAELNKANREFYEEQWQIQRENDWRKMLAQMEYNTTERAEAQKWQEGMWNLQFNAINDYNTPVHQMQRMMAAGINPNAAAGIISGSPASPSVPSSSGASSSLGSPSPSGQPQVFNPADSFASMMNVGANAEAAIAQAQLSRQMAKKTEAETVGLAIDNKYKPFEKDAQLDEVRANIDLMAKNGELSVETAEQLRVLTPILRDRNLAEIDKLFAETDLAFAEIDNLDQQIKLVEAQVETERHKQKLMDAQSYEAYMSGQEHKSAIDLNGKRGSLADAERWLNDARKRKESQEAKFRENVRKRYGFDPALADRYTNFVLMNWHSADNIRSGLSQGVQRSASYKLKAGSLFSGYNSRANRVADYHMLHGY